MMIDFSTIYSLELVQNLQNLKSKDCLFGLLNQTLTPMGSRLLRSNILQPLTEADIISKRYDALEELTTKEEMFFATRQGLLEKQLVSDFAVSMLTCYSIKVFFRCRQDSNQCKDSTETRINLITLADNHYSHEAIYSACGTVY